jgi:hypothetical protein
MARLVLLPLAAAAVLLPVAVALVAPASGLLLPHRGGGTEPDDREQ